MLDLHACLLAALAIATLSFLGWLVSLWREDVSHVDVLWSSFFALGTLVYALAADAHGPRLALLGLTLGAWAVRLAVYIGARNWGRPEDHRYRAIRARNEPNFAWKSLYLVFGLQAVLALIIGTPLWIVAGSSAPLSAIDIVGLALWLAGFTCELLADWQLARFKRDPAHQGQVLDQGLWRYSRHPNYFGEALVWWGFYALAVAAGGGWTVFAPVLITFLLLKVSGVALLERDINERRPQYRVYMQRTSPFIPWVRRAAPSMSSKSCRLGCALGPLLALLGCRSASGLPPLETVSHVDLPRFMGDWYVIANIPTALERGAHNPVESYRLAADGTIETTFTFRAGAFDGVLKSYHPRGFVLDHDSNAVWGMQFIWPIKADYRIVYLDDDYSLTVIGREARDYVWVMAREPQISADAWTRITDLLQRVGYDTSKLQKPPQRWPADAKR